MSGSRDVVGVPLASPFEIAAPRRIVFGVGKSAELSSHVARWVDPAARRVLVVTGASHRHEHVVRALETIAEVIVERVAGEPTVERCEAAVARARAARVSVVVGLGGGSALDLGKAIAALVPSERATLDHLEVVGRGLPLERAPLPYIAVPTTAGTGAEATKNAVLTARSESGEPVKVSLRDDRMLPVLALVDPSLTLAVPPAVTAATGLDALTQVIEPFVSNAATPFTDALCAQAIPLAARSLVRAFERGDDLAARTDLALVSLYGGLALANAKLGAVHGFAGPLGGRLGAPHGAICARLLPRVVEANARALSARAPSSPVLGRYEAVARWLVGSERAGVDDAVRWLDEVVERLAIPRLSAWGLAQGELASVADASARSSSMRGNPIALGADELVSILHAAL